MAIFLSTLSSVVCNYLKHLTHVCTILFYYNLVIKKKMFWEVGDPSRTTHKMEKVEEKKKQNFCKFTYRGHWPWPSTGHVLPAGDTAGDAAVQPWAAAAAATRPARETALAAEAPAQRPGRRLRPGSNPRWWRHTCGSWPSCPRWWAAWGPLQWQDLPPGRNQAWASYPSPTGRWRTAGLASQTRPAPTSSQ